MAKGGISPRIYVSGGFNTGYFDGDTLGFNTQINNNQNQWVNMGITIPIFNGASVYSRIKRKKIAVFDSELNLQKQREDLYTEIWNAIDDLQSAESEYQASIELYGFSKLTLQNVTKKMEKGLAGPTDFEAAKQRFVNAEATLLKSKLVYIMRRQMLEFYRTGNWGHLR
jgi:outer membrane protein